MHILWGAIIAGTGMMLIAAATVRSEFVLYRLIVARSRLLWGDNVYKFHKVAGLLITVFGILVALGLVGG